MKRIILVVLLLANCTIPISSKEETKSLLLTSLLLNDLNDKNNFPDLVEKPIFFSLSWNQFKGPVLSNQVEKNPAAISTMINYNFVSRGKINVFCSIIENQSMRQDIDWAEMSRFSSKEEFWDWILEHEQHHLDICTIEARKAYIEKIATKKYPMTDPQKSALLRNDILIEIQKVQIIYDEETKGSTNVEVQKSWNQKIKSQKN